jgi:hypothetical protein
MLHRLTHHVSPLRFELYACLALPSRITVRHVTHCGSALSSSGMVVLILVLNWFPPQESWPNSSGNHFSAVLGVITRL